MKNIFLVFFFFPLFVLGQITSPSLVSSSGGSYSNNNLNIEFSVGQLVIETHQNNDILTQGFHQGSLKIQTTLSEIKFEAKVYPNPTSDIIVVELAKDVKGDILVYDVNGKLVLSDQLYQERKKQFDFRELNQGNYLLHLKIDDKQNIYKIQKIK